MSVSSTTDPSPGEMLLAVYLIGTSLLMAGAIPRDYTWTIKAHDEDLSDQLTRDRRVMLVESFLWPEAIVPFVFQEDALPEVPELNRVMSFIEDQSCGRFTYWNQNTTSQLGHDGRISFMKSTGCSSFVVGLHKGSGRISCCSAKGCLHELGHVFGFSHEQVNPNRDGWIRINEDNIVEGSLGTYRKTRSKSQNFTFPYDITSIMNYRRWMKAIDDRGSYIKLFPELSLDEEYFYFFRELAGGYKCHEKPQCKGRLLKCENEGYQTILHGKCACKCPSGLDPDNLCKTPLKKVTSASWPKGQYALPMPQSGCPNQAVFQDGRLLYSGTGGNSMSTPYHMMGKVDDKMVELNFCTKTTRDDVYDFEEGAKFNWPHGNYCIYRKGNTCPKGFTTNTIYHTSVNTPSVSGQIPDGVYGKDIELNLCCSYRAFHEEPMVFPTDKPFSLFKVPEDDDCQEVEGMRFTEEAFTLTSSNELTIDPLFSDWVTDDKKSLEVKLCHYRPRDMDCGGAITLSQSKPEATIEMSGNGRTDLGCTWVVKGDTDKGTLVFDFEDFDLKKTGESCDDNVEVRHALIGQLGQEYKSLECPSEHNPRRSIRSIYDKMLLRFSTNGNSNSSFKARIKWIASEDMCYKVDNRGADYEGNVNYTRSFLQCLPWAEMVHCPQKPFLPNAQVKHSPGDVVKNLEGNKCRNPDNSFRPWCYTERYGCLREYCDVCGLEKPFDRLDYCNEMKNQGLCTSDAAQAVQYCAKTCQDVLPNKKPWKKYTEMTCGQPTPPPDGTMLGTLKPKYKVGDRVEYKCNTVSSVVMSRCQASGQWSQVDSSCLPCSSDRTFFNNTCYGTATNEIYHLYDNVVRKCKYGGGVLAAPKSMEENNVIRKIADEKDFGNIWIAVKEFEDGNIRYEDGTELVWENWADGEPGGPREDCLRHVVMRRNKKWGTGACSYPYRFICAFPPHEFSDCLDVFGDKCSSLLTERPSFCVDQPNYAMQYCRRSCGICKEKNISCSVENLNLGVVTLSTNKSTISVGEYVNYECDRSRYRVKGDESRACRPNGTLSGNPLECSDCPVGFKLMNNACHGLVLTKDKAVTYSDAQEVCKTLDGYLALPKTQEENDLIASIGFGRPIRIGSSDKYSDVNVWEDGVYMSWNNWESEKPFRSGKYCTVMNSDKTWVKVNCDEDHSEYPIVCTIKENDLCYDLKDKGVSYDGWVNYTETFQSCRPWAQTTGCYLHSFKDGAEEDNLEDNYCRNPDNSIRPWCYYDGCSWAYCDVCGTYNLTDTIQNCQAFKSQGLCTKDKDKAVKDCVETCRDELNMKVPVVKKYKDIRCGPPRPPIDGVVVGQVQNQYKIGDSVEIKCKSEPWTVFSRCLTSGQWSEVVTACTQTDCAADIFDNICYNMKRTPKWYPYDEALAACQERNGTVAVPRNLEEADFIMDVVEWRYTWLGIIYNKTEKTWLYNNGSQLVWTNWDDGEPNKVKVNEGVRCAVMNRSRRWQVEPCELANRLTCAFPRKDSPVCSDFYAKCSKQLVHQPSMCTEHEGYARIYCPKTCGFCRG